MIGIAQTSVSQNTTRIDTSVQVLSRQSDDQDDSRGGDGRDYTLAAVQASRFRFGW